MIEIKDLKKSFGEKTVLRGVDLNIKTGETTCIIGRSGCGKSVLLKLVVGLLAPDEGTVVVDGVDISKMTQPQLFQMRRHIGYVFQGAALFDSLNVYDNVVMSLVEHGETDGKILDGEARRVLSAVGLLPSLERAGTPVYEGEYSNLRLKKPSDLSGGMRKRVGVARALVGKPDYIFYDEPTTGLDPITSQQIDDLIETLDNTIDATSVVISHDIFSVFNIADHVIMLEGGLVHFEGNVDDLRSTTDPVVVEFLRRYVS